MKRSSRRGKHRANVMREVRREISAAGYVATIRRVFASMGIAI